MKVEQAMTRDLGACRPLDVLAVAVRIMRDRGCGFVPVTDAAGHVLGVLTDRDVCLKLLELDRSLHAIPVEQAMTREVRSIAPAASIEDARAAMRNWRVRRLPVVDEGGRLVGVLSLDDLAARTPVARLADDEVGWTLRGIVQPTKTLDVTR